MGQIKAQQESLKIQLSREVRYEMSDSMDSLRQQLEARINHITSMQEKAFEDMKENEKRNIRFLTCKIDEKEGRLRRDATRMLQAHAVGVAESESRMQQELKAESERMKDFKEQIAALATANKDGADGGTGIDSAAEQVIKTSLNDLKREMEEVRQQGKSLQDKLKSNPSSFQNHCQIPCIPNSMSLNC